MPGSWYAKTCLEIAGTSEKSGFFRWTIARIHRDFMYFRSQLRCHDQLRSRSRQLKQSPYTGLGPVVTTVSLPIRLISIKLVTRQTLGGK